MSFIILNNDKKFLIDYILSYYKPEQQEKQKSKLQNASKRELKCILRTHLNTHKKNGLNK